MRAEVQGVLDAVEARRPGIQFEVEELLSVLPTHTPNDCDLVEALGRAIETTTGTAADLVASPGTYDHKHFQRIGGIGQCVAYGPGELEQAHQPDERCLLSDITQATQVMALAIVDLLS